MEKMELSEALKANASVLEGMNQLEFFVKKISNQSISYLYLSF